MPALKLKNYNARKELSDKFMPRFINWIKIAMPEFGELIRTDVEENGLKEFDFQGIDLIDAKTGKMCAVRLHQLKSRIFDDFWIRTHKGENQKFSEWAWWLKNEKPDYLFYFWVDGDDIIALYYIDIQKLIKTVRADKTRQYIYCWRMMEDVDDGSHCIHFYYDDIYSKELFNLRKRETE